MATLKMPESSTQRLDTDEDLNAKTMFEASSFLSSYNGGVIEKRIMFPNEGRLSRYNPSCHMMDYIIHAMNRSLCNNFYFKRANPDFHPYILRLYCGILFWIQCLRAGNDVNALSNDQHMFLNRFLDQHSPETLAVPGPLLGLFQTLCSSQAEFPHVGEVYPSVPVKPGPARREHFMSNLVEMHFLPNVPGIFALLEDLNRLFTQDTPVYPKLGNHIPVREGEISTFGHHIFGINDDDRWSLVSPGLQYRCEADQKLNETFAERYDDFGFVPTSVGDNLTKISSFLHMKQSMAWFTQVKNVATSVASSFNGSGTLADCSPHGVVANQVVVCLTNPKHPPEAPRCSADKRSLYEFGYKLKSTAHNLHPLAETVAAYSQTHIRMFSNHPHLAGFGSKTAICGPFWDIRPIGSSLIDKASFLAIPLMVNRAMMTKGPSI